MADRIPEAPTQVPTDLPVDPHEALTGAARILDDLTPQFVAGVGARPHHIKGSRTDFATEVDLALEREITSRLVEDTGLEVHGEEFGGPPVNTGTLWVVDPVDGTGNYSLGIPATAMMISLVHERQPIIGLTWMPLLGLRVTSVVGGPVELDGQPAPPLDETHIRDVAVSLGSLSTGSRTTYPGPYRREVYESLTVNAARTRKLGSTGVDLSFVALSRFAAALSFGNYAWDNAAGACHVRCAGGVVTDLSGTPWSTDSDSILAGAPGAHEEVLDVLRQLGEPATFHEADRRRAGPEVQPEQPWLRRT